MDESLLSIEFVTLHDYLYLLRGIAQALNSYGRNVVFYLAAAVSDFHIPASDMVNSFFKEEKKTTLKFYRLLIWTKYPLFKLYLNSAAAGE